MRDFFFLFFFFGEVLRGSSAEDPNNPASKLPIPPRGND